MERAGSMERIRPMTAIEMGADAIDRQDPPQAKRCERLVRILGSAALAGALAGCSGLPGVMHRMEGGQIAKPLKPPPGIDKPFPNLASVPARPAAPDQAALERLSQSLIADRENARHLTVAAPDPSLPAASPGLFGVGSLPPPQPAGSGAAATLAAAQGPPPSTPATAPPATVPAAAAPPVASPPAPQAGTARAPVVSTPLASVPAGPPAPARIASPAPTAASVGTPIPPEPSPPVNPATTVNVSFPPASAVLPAEAADALHALATRRGGHAVAVVGHGDATSTDPDAQSQAVALGLQRAQAIAQSLAAAGVPDSAVRLDAEAGGRGGSARILQ